MFDNQDISYSDPSPLYGQNVLVTGGSGAFGKAFVKRCLDDGARRVVVFSRDEAKQAKMKSEFPDDRLRFFVGDVRDESRVMEAFRDVDVVIHAAAMKRVETCEENPNEAVATNVIGTQNVARACIGRGVLQAIFLSTDKAASPNTLYGATKLTAERLWIASNAMAAGTNTRFACTRYGNVLGSTGSVIPTWKAQAQNGSVSITNPSMTRFWLKMDDAVNLVILALRNMRSGEIFIPKAGSSTVFSLAHAVVPNAEFQYTGTRPGEKMHELLISQDESRNAYDCGTHYLIEPETRSWGEIPRLIYPKVPQGFEYGSETNPNRLSTEQLRDLAA